MTVRTITLARGVLFYPHALRVIWREDSAHPCMSWPLPLAGEESGQLHEAALAQTDTRLRSLMFRALSVNAAFAQMVYRDNRTKRDHVCATLRKACRALAAPEKEGTT